MKKVLVFFLETVCNYSSKSSKHNILNPEADVDDHSLWHMLSVLGHRISSIGKLLEYTIGQIECARG